MPDANARDRIVTSGDVSPMLDTGHGPQRFGLELLTARYGETRDERNRPQGGTPYTFAFLWIAGCCHSLGSPVRGTGWTVDRLDAALRRFMADHRRPPRHTAASPTPCQPQRLRP
jgi:hypothetical protein